MSYPIARAIIIWGVLALAATALLGFAAWLWTLPATTEAAVAPQIPKADSDALLATLKPRHGGRPLVAIIGINNATETTDYIMTAGILRRADIADVLLLATDEGAVQLYPALKVEPDSTVADFDAKHPQGADYVIVPAMSRDDDPTVMRWLKTQAQKGSTIIGVCAGAKVVAAAGLLDNRRATTHWYYRSQLLSLSPTILFAENRRMVADKGTVTTTGISASMPMMLTLIEAIAGRPKADEVAHKLGLATFDARHASNAFKLTRPFALTVLRNRLAFWSHETRQLQLHDGIDEVTVALVADAWSRTYLSRVSTVAAKDKHIVSANGFLILPDQASISRAQDNLDLPALPPGTALEETLREISSRFGLNTADVVAMQLEYPWKSTKPQIGAEP